MSDPENPLAKLDQLLNWFCHFNSCLVAFSGGVDSAVLSFAAHKALGRNAIAVTSLSPAFAKSELEIAKKVSKEIGIELITVNQDDLADSSYIENSVSRCYFCRNNLTYAMESVVKSRNPEVCIDGTHVDDMRSPRPGIKALREARFRAPFVELNISKSDIRDIARFVHLSNAERPSEACLSSRIAYGQEIDRNILKMIERSEEFIRNLTGATQVRVRTIGSRAIVELDQTSIESASSAIGVISHKLKSFGYSEVEIDPEGYQPGRMLSLFVQESH